MITMKLVDVHIDDVRDAAGAAVVSRVFDEVWRARSMVPPEVIVAAVHAGGHAAVARRGDEVVGASFGIHGRPLDGERGANLHSHVTGVVDGWGARGVGTALKHHQWHWARERGLSTLTWTFDPLVRRNAAFNLVTLGVTIETYLTDFYGHLDDGLNAGDESDRLFVRWRVAGLDEPPRGAMVDARAGDVRIETPEDVAALRRDDPTTARRWRLEVRDHFAQLPTHWRVRGFDGGGSYVVGPT
jgi:predicted GNAT superfamily acetyltransferase